MTVEQFLQLKGGVARTGTLLDAGLDERSIEQGVDEGRILRVRCGVLALPGAPADFVRAVGGGARLTCVSAAVHYGLWLVRPPVVMHVSRPTMAVDGCINHRGVTVPVHPHLPVVGLADVLVHALQCRPVEESVPMVECALRRGDTVAAFLEARLRGDRDGRARRALAQADPTGESAIEVVTRMLLRGLGLDVRPQARIAYVGRVDFPVGDFLIVEIDGAAFHSDRRALRRDRLRNNQSVLGGYTVLRFCYEDVMFSPGEVAGTVLAALGHRPVR